MTKLLAQIEQFDYAAYIHTPIGKIIIFILAILVMSFLINYLLSHSILGGSYRLFVAPGVIVHEFSHALFCVLTGAKIKSINLFDKEGGSVEHGPSKVPVLGQIIISLAPFFIGGMAIFFLAKMIGLKEVNIIDLSLSKEGAFSYIKQIMGNLNFTEVKTWILFYITLSIAVTMTPSAQDIRNIFLSIVGLLLIILLVTTYSSFRFDWSFLPIAPLFTVLGSIIMLLILALLASIIIYGVSKLIKV